MSTAEETREGFYLGEDGEWVPNGWNLILLGDKCDEITVGFVGSMAEHYVTEGIPFLRSKNIEPFKINYSDLCHISKEFHQTLKKSELHPGDIAVVRTGKPGAAVLIPPDLGTANCSDLVIIRCGDELHREFIVYFLNSAAKGFIFSALVGAVQQHFNVGEAKKLPIPLPPLGEQKAIADVFESLGKKVELLRNQNETFEEIAQTLFKRWFIDFNFPDENGNPYKDSDGKMQSSEFGEIPKSWEVGSISLFADHIKNSVSPHKSPETLYRHYSIPSFDDGMEPVQELGLEIKSNKYEVVASSILVSKLNPSTPRIWQIQDAEENSICSTEFQVVKPQSGFFGFVYGALMSSPVRRELTGRAHGTSSSHQRVSPADIFEVPFPVSSDRKLEATFSDTSHGLLKKIAENRAQIQTLIQLRDTLLPKLMKGEIRVPIKS